MRTKLPKTLLMLTLISTLSLTFAVRNVCAVSSWVWVRNTVTGAYGEAVVGTGDALFIARGTKLYRFLPAINSWSEIATPPNPDSGDSFKTGTFLAWDYGNCIYALYGAATGDSRRWFGRYSISGNSWQMLANTTFDQGEGDALAWVSSQNCLYATMGGEQRSTHFMRYDPNTNIWNDAPADPPAGMGDGASLVWTGGNYLYALRGEFLEESPLYDFWRYSLADDSWTAMADIPAEPHSDGSGGVGDGGSLLYVGTWLSDYSDYIYALSGNQAHPENPVRPDNRTYRYTISTSIWERLADLPFGVGYYVGCRLGYADGHIYAWQGAPSTWVGGGDDLVKYQLPITDSNPPTTTHNYDGLWHKTDFTITLTAFDDLSGVNQTCYRINGGQIRIVSIDGQPRITTESSNNTLEYWSVDNTGHEEQPHKMLAEIKLDKTPPTVEVPSRTPDGDVQPDQEVKISANISDLTSNVKNATLQYTLNDGATWSDLDMTHNSTTGLYETAVPGQLEGTVVRFRMYVYDNAGNNVTKNGSEPYCVYTVIPEFSSIIILLLSMVACAFVGVYRSRKTRKRVVPFL